MDWWIVFPVNLAGGIALPEALWRLLVVISVWWVEEIPLVTFASLFSGSVKDVVFESALRIRI